ncbi:MAG TPA: hypothetical protein VNB90_04185 [Cytophagaceae bacterium]|jgi:hypothetical protein|nr:hypothetical protein [Cytophagaceae bacterium]
MKRKVIFATCAFALFVVCFVHATINSLTVRYYNKDSKTYVFDAKIAGSSTKVEFGGSRTASVTIQGGSNSAVIKTSCGEVTLKDGDNIEIQNGCITVK